VSTRWMEMNIWVDKSPDISPEEKWANIKGHKWETVSLAEKYACESMVGTADFCSVCGVAYATNLSAWPCEVMQTGWRPEKETLLSRRNRERNRQSPSR